MSDETTGGFGWLPPRVRQAIEHADARARLEAKRDADARAERLEQKREAAVAEFGRQAELRGEHVSAVRLAAGEDLGRSVEDVLDEAREAGKREEARQAALDRYKDGNDWVWIGSGEPVIHEPVSRSGLVDDYAIDRLIRRQQDDRSWIAGLQMRRAAARGQAQAHIKAQREAAEARRSSGGHDPDPYHAEGHYVVRGIEDAVTGVW